MNAITSSQRHAGVSALAAAAHGALRVAERLNGALRALARRVTDAWNHGAARREFERLDASTLRDLGMSPSEFDSYWAETHGLAEQTRRRVLGL